MAFVGKFYLIRGVHAGVVDLSLSDTCKLLFPGHNVFAVHSLMVSEYAGNLESVEAGAGECPHCDWVLAERLINWTQPGCLFWQITRANEKINSTQAVSIF